MKYSRFPIFARKIGALRFIEMIIATLSAQIFISISRKYNVSNYVQYTCSNVYSSRILCVMKYCAYGIKYFMYSYKLIANTKMVSSIF